MKLVFFGTPADAVPTLDALLAAGHDIPLVVTQPDRRRGRGGRPTPSPIKEAAVAHGLEVRTPERAREVVDEVGATGAEVGVVVAFGQLLPAALLDAVPHGFVNVHFSLLPRWRGAAPVERALLAGDTETGVCIMRLDEGMDTGPVFECRATPIGDEESAGQVRDRLASIGAELLVAVLPTVPAATPRPQEGEATLAPKLSVDEFRVEPDRPAPELARVVRAGNPRPGAWLMVEGRRLRILRATPIAGSGDPGAITRAGELVTSDGVLRLEEVQPEGGRVMTGQAWRAGRPGEFLVVDRA